MFLTFNKNMKSFKINPLHIVGAKPSCIVGHDRKPLGSYIYTPITLYTTTSGMTSTDTITHYPQDITLTFGGKVKTYDEAGVLVTDTTDQITVTHTIRNRKDLVSAYYWNNVPVNYNLKENLPIT